MFTDIYTYKWRGILFSATVAVLLSFGLLMRSQFVGDASVEIGGTFAVQSGQVVFRPFEDGSRIEAYYNNWLLPNDLEGTFQTCSFKAAFSPDGQKLDIRCGGKTEEDLRETIMLAVRPLLKRHEKLYQIAVRIDENERLALEGKISKSVEMIKVWKKAPASIMSKAEIINQAANIDEYEDKLRMRNLLGDRLKPTRFDGNGFLIVNRKPNLGTWFFVLFISLCSGIGVSLFSARIKEV